MPQNMDMVLRSLDDPLVLLLWRTTIWKLNCPLKRKIFLWMVFSKGILVWYFLMRKICEGPGRCPLCCVSSKSIDYLFLHYYLFSQVWDQLRYISGTLLTWKGTNILDAFFARSLNPINRSIKSLLTPILYKIWSAMNRSIF